MDVKTIMTSMRRSVNHGKNRPTHARIVNELYNYNDNAALDFNLQAKYISIYFIAVKC